LVLAPIALCKRGEAEGENGLPLPLRLGLPNGDSAGLGLKLREAESGEEWYVALMLRLSLEAALRGLLPEKLEPGKRR
jgi:hypothetical protein